MERDNYIPRKGRGGSTHSPPVNRSTKHHNTQAAQHLLIAMSSTQALSKTQASSNASTAPTTDTGSTRASTMLTPSGGPSSPAPTGSTSAEDRLSGVVAEFVAAKAEKTKRLYESASSQQQYNSALDHSPTDCLSSNGRSVHTVEICIQKLDRYLEAGKEVEKIIDPFAKVIRRFMPSQATNSGTEWNQGSTGAPAPSETLPRESSASNAPSSASLEDRRNRLTEVFPYVTRYQDAKDESDKRTKDFCHNMGEFVEFWGNEIRPEVGETGSTEITTLEGSIAEAHNATSTDYRDVYWPTIIRLCTAKDELEKTNTFVASLIKPRLDSLKSSLRNAVEAFKTLQWQKDKLRGQLSMFCDEWSA